MKFVTRAYSSTVWTIPIDSVFERFVYKACHFALPFADSCIHAVDGCHWVSCRERERNVLFNDTLNTFYYSYVEGWVLFNDALNTFYLRLYGEREMFYLTTHSTHFIYDYMVSDIWLRTILIVRKETRCRHIGYSYRLTARITHTTAFVTPVVEHWLEREIAQWVHPMKDPQIK